MDVTRRQMIGTGAAGGAVAAAGLLGLSAPAGAVGSRRGGPNDGSQRDLFGPLAAGPDDLLALPEGFSYQVVAQSGETDVEDGSGTVIGKTPCRPDGTRTVRTGRGYRLVQNHEVTPGYGDTPVVPHVAGTVYDELATEGGGCTVIEVDRSGRRLSQWVGISGTVGNCAGGPTPWGSWLTCEETEVKADGASYAQDHGYVFEVFAGGPDDQVPLPIKAWGRAPHEAVVVEPGQRRVYLTEDASKPTGLLYRWSGPKIGPGIAHRLSDDAGTLEAMAVLTNDGSVLPDLAYVTAAEIGRPFRTSWVEVPDRQATSTSLRKQFADGEVTRSKKLEGAWGDEQGMYFVASFAFSAGDLPADATPHDGQLWFYEFRRQTLTLLAYFPYNALLHTETPGWETGLGLSLDLAFDGPDGCHVSPYGAVILTEDGNTANHVLSWTRETGTQAIARNNIIQKTSGDGGNVYSEMTGPCFSPDGKILFANVQEPGYTFAITGPWGRYLR
jgi:uncharacterized protein